MYVLDTECLLNPAPILWSGECLQIPHHLGLELWSALLKPVTAGTALRSACFGQSRQSVTGAVAGTSGQLLRSVVSRSVVQLVIQDRICWSVSQIVVGEPGQGSYAVNESLGQLNRQAVTWNRGLQVRYLGNNAGLYLQANYTLSNADWIFRRIIHLVVQTGSSGELYT